MTRLPNSLFGLSVEVYKGRFPPEHTQDVKNGLRVCVGEEVPYVELRELWYECRYSNANTGPEYRAWRTADGGVYCQSSDGIQFVLTADASRVWTSWANSSSFEDAVSYLLGPVMGMVLNLRETPTLHGSAVALEGRAVAFIGESGAGKSTTAAAFAQRGQPVLTEDIVALSSDLKVQPGYPLVRLWPHSAQLLFGSSSSLPQLTPNWNKCYLDLEQPGYHFQDSPLSLGAVYVLALANTGIEPHVRELGAAEAMMKLVANGYTSHLPADDRFKEKEFNTWARIVQSVPVIEIGAAPGLKNVHDICELVTSDFQSRNGRVRQDYCQ